MNNISPTHSRWHPTVRLTAPPRTRRSNTPPPQEKQSDDPVPSAKRESNEPIRGRQVGCSQDAMVSHVRGTCSTSPPGHASPEVVSPDAFPRCRDCSLQPWASSHRIAGQQTHVEGSVVVHQTTPGLAPSLGCSRCFLFCRVGIQPQCRCVY